jgi:polysaccharide biosynthesis protein PslG
LLTLALLSALGLVVSLAFPSSPPGTARQLTAAERGPGGRPEKKKNKISATSWIASTTTVASPTAAPDTTSTTSSTSQPTASLASGSGVGVQFHAMWSDYTDAQRLAVLDKLAAAHLSWVRIDMAWAGFEDRCRGCYNEWYLDMANFTVDAARARGMQVLVMLWRTPGWANGNKGAQRPPDDPGDYGRFAGWLASKMKGRVAAYEIWNEPDPSQSFFLGTQDQYVALLKAAYPAIHAADPATRVVLGGPSSNDDAWIEGIYARGGKGYFDVLATHPYQGKSDAPPEHPDDGSRWWFTHLPAVRDVMLKHGDSAKPIWFTEFGWSSHPNTGGESNWELGVSLQQQADYTIRAIKYARANFPYVTTMILYNDRNRDSGDVQLDGYGILYRDLSAKPVYTALRSALGS